MCFQGSPISTVATRSKSVKSRSGFANLPGDIFGSRAPQGGKRGAMTPGIQRYIRFFHRRHHWAVAWWLATASVLIAPPLWARHHGTWAPAADVIQAHAGHRVNQVTGHLGLGCEREEGRRSYLRDPNIPDKPEGWFARALSGQARGIECAVGHCRALDRDRGQPVCSMVALIVKTYTETPKAKRPPFRGSFIDSPRGPPATPLSLPSLRWSKF